LIERLKKLTKKKNFSKIIKIIFVFVAGIILLCLGLWFLIDIVSITIIILVILYFNYYVLIDPRSISNIIFICGIVSVVSGIILLSIGILLTIKMIKKKELKRVERQDYMNFDWLRDQYYELGRSVQEIATDQGVPIGTIQKWLYKLDVESAGLGVEN
jgi:putative Mn2+ efflux pump MntP